MGVIMLLPGASTLRLDENGFEFTRFFRKQNFNWTEVSDFGVWTTLNGFRGLVVFKRDKPRLKAQEKINAALTNGRNGYLPDTYGLPPEELAELMNQWKHRAAAVEAGVIQLPISPEH